MLGLISVYSKEPKAIRLRNDEETFTSMPDHACFRRAEILRPQFAGCTASQCWDHAVEISVSRRYRFGSPL